MAIPVIQSNVTPNDGTLRDDGERISGATTLAHLGWGVRLLTENCRLGQAA
jgi:hypothetical protein